ncbi:YjbF family lipoprotein [Roseivivax sp. CAU 1753]
MMRIVPLLLLGILVACTQAPPPLGTFRAGLTPELVATAPGDLLYVAVEGLKNESTVQPIEEIDGVINWRTPDNTSEIATRDGIIVATRSLGDDLMSADVAGSQNALRGRDGGDYYPRFHTTLDGEYQPQFRSFQCIVARRSGDTLTVFDRRFPATKIEETCTTPGMEVTNTYWLGSDGTMLRSRQWISEGVGYIQTERLK